MTAAFALATSATHVACACASGVVRLFQHHTLAFQFNLPRPAGRGSATAAASGKLALAAGNPAAPGVTSLTTCADLFPDALACSFGCTGKQLSVVYSDRSLVMWDVRSSSKVRLCEDRGQRRAKDRFDACTQTRLLVCCSWLGWRERPGRS